MNAMNVYLSTCRYFLQINPEFAESWSDLYRFLPYLRQALTCCVCGGLLKQPVSPVNAKSCQHHVCKQCIGGKMKVRPSCSWCKEWDIFSENIQLRIILQCFKDLCLQLKESPIYHELTTTTQGERFKISTILQDGVDIEDYKYPAKNKFANISHWPLPHFTFLASNQVSHVMTHHKENLKNESNENTSANFGNDCSTSDAECHQITVEVDPNGAESEADEQTPPNIKERTVTHTHVPLRVSMCDLQHENPKSTDPPIEERRSIKLKISVAGNICVPILTPEIIPTDNISTDSDSKTDAHSRRRQNSGQAKRPKLEAQPSRKVCRCGTANTPNKLTCYCQRCPCYSLKLGCFGCKCRGCRNPYNKKKAESPPENSTLQEVNVET